MLDGNMNPTTRALETAKATKWVIGVRKNALSLPPCQHNSEGITPHPSTDSPPKIKQKHNRDVLLVKIFKWTFSATW